MAYLINFGSADGSSLPSRDLIPHASDAGATLPPKEFKPQSIRISSAVTVG